jgi:hypothetical protein
MNAKLVPGDDIIEGTCDRTGASLRHLLINVGSTHTADWRLWCTGTKGHDTAGPPPHPKLCGSCRGLAREAVAAGYLDAAEVNAIAVSDPLDTRDIHEWV